jgi:3',5'-cyclic AMP phosphodiesterase CpdA
MADLMHPNFDLTWLHLSDLHVGIADQGWLWPTLKHAFFEDLRKILEKTGKCDLVIFSGDLTQQAKTSEFNSLTAILNEMWSEFDAMGFSPYLITVPG